jgi:hypothetical protein
MSPIGDIPAVCSFCRRAAVPRSLEPDCPHPLCAEHFGWWFEGDSRPGRLEVSSIGHFDATATAGMEPAGSVVSPAGDIPAGAAYRERMLTLAQLAEQPPLKPAVAGLFDLDSLVLLYGRRGACKSFLAIDLLASINVGDRWQGREVAQGPVVYVIGEGVGGLSARFNAWFAVHYPTPTLDERHDDLLVLPEVVNLLSPPTVALFTAAVAELHPRLIVFDTLARMMLGGDENSARDAGLAVEQLDHIRRRTGAAILAVHHSGKNGEAGARGSSAFEAAADTVLAVEAADGSITISCSKQKNHIEPKPIRLSTRTVGDSIVLEQYRGDGDTLSASAVGALEALIVACAGEIDGVSASKWLAASGLPERTWYRAKAQLIDLGHVAVTTLNRTPKFTPTATGTATLIDAVHDA